MFYIFIVSNIITGVGYNGFPTGCDDDVLPWGKNKADRSQTKYMYVCHAEMNAILNKVCFMCQYFKGIDNISIHAVITLMYYSCTQVPTRR